MAAHTQLKGYALSISAATGYGDPAIVAAIEDAMRIERPTLDALTRKQFDRLARDSVPVAAVLAAAQVADWMAELAR